jgi:uncharacterized membrane protein
MNRLINPATIFAAIALIFGTYFVLVIPPLWGVDEYTHFDRAYQLSEGVFIAHRVNEEGYGGELPENLIRLNQMIHLDLADNRPAPDVFHRQDVDNPDAYKELVKQRPSRTWHDFPFNGAAAYSPVAYAPAIFGILVGRAVHLPLQGLITLARFCTLLFYIGVVSFAIWVAPNRGVKWLIFVAALLPMSLFQAAIVNADAVVIASSLIVLSLAVTILHTEKPTSWQWALLIIASVILPLAKPNYGLLSMLSVFIVFFKIQRKVWPRLALAVVLLGAIIGPTAAWGMMANTKATTTAGLIPSFIGHVSAQDQTQAIIHSPHIFFGSALPYSIVENQDAYINSMIGVLGWNFVSIPDTFVTLLLMLLVLAALYSQPFASKGWSAVILAVCMAAVVSIFLSLYILFSAVRGPIIYGVQGRYFVPLLSFAALAATRFIPIRISMGPRAAMIVFSSGTVLSLGAAATYYALGTY